MNTGRQLTAALLALTMLVSGAGAQRPTQTVRAQARTASLRS